MSSSKAVNSVMNNTPRMTYLDNMRAGAIIMVVVIHSMGYCGELTTGHREIIDFLVHTIAVPVFFLVDGYLAINSYLNGKQVVYAEVVKRSFRRLMVPWIIFTVVYTVSRFVFEHVGVLHDHLLIGHSLKQVLWAMYGSVYAPQMYFLFSLFLIRLHLPLLFHVVHKGRISFVIFFCVYLFFCQDIGRMLAPYLHVEGGQEPILHAIWGGQFYLCGVLLRLIERDFDSFFRWLFPVTLMVLLLYKNVIIFDQGQHMVQYAYLLGYFSFFYVLKAHSLDFSKVGKNTMGIYLIHAPVVLKVVSLVVRPFIANGLLSLFVIVLFCFLISYQITILINSIPRGRMLFGAS